MDGLIFAPAERSQLEDIFQLYRLAVGRPFCAWDDAYPGRTELSHDWDTGNLYALTRGGRVIGAISVVPENELDNLPGWQFRNGTQREIARVVIAEAYRGQGLAQYMVTEISRILKEQNWRAIHLSVAQDNAPAARVYRRCGFRTVGAARLYGGTYLLLEKVL